MTNDLSAAVDLCHRIEIAAEKHGEDSGEPDHEVGDLQDALFAAVSLLSELLGPSGIAHLENGAVVQQILRGPDWEEGDENE